MYIHWCVNNKVGCHTIYIFYQQYLFYLPCCIWTQIPCHFVQIYCSSSSFFLDAPDKQSHAVESEEFFAGIRVCSQTSCFFLFLFFLEFHMVRLIITTCNIIASLLWLDCSSSPNLTLSQRMERSMSWSQRALFLYPVFQRHALFHYSSASAAKVHISVVLPYIRCTVTMVFSGNSPSATYSIELQRSF